MICQCTTTYDEMETASLDYPEQIEKWIRVREEYESGPYESLPESFREPTTSLNMVVECTSPLPSRYYIAVKGIQKALPGKSGQDEAASRELDNPNHSQVQVRDITDLGETTHYLLQRTTRATVTSYDKANFVATSEIRGIAASGDSIEEAVDNLKDTLISKYKLLRRFDKLGSLARSQFEQLSSVIRERD